MKNFKKAAMIMAAALIVLSATGCAPKADTGVVIYTCTEDFRTEHIRQLLKERFPNYVITLQTLSTGNHAAKLKAEGTQSEADITLNLETGYLAGLGDILADLSDFDLSPFLPELVPANHTYVPWDKSSGAIVLNRDKMSALNVAAPQSYADLLQTQYHGILSMPNPKTSGTGYMFLVSLINAWGEDAAFDYFDKFAENVLQFTTSGSGPVNALLQGEAAVGLGMTLTAVQAINSKNANFQLLYFAEGAPNITTGMGIIKGKEKRAVVKEVFEFAMTKLNRDDKELYCPEQIFIDQTNNIPNYPKNIQYADMTGVYDLALKDRLLAKWKY